MRAYGSNRITNDTDVCFERTPENLERLASALTDIDARRITDLHPEGVPTRITSAYLEREEMFVFMTDFGQLDLLANPAGIKTFAQLKEDSVGTELGSVTVLLASPAALRRMKAARGWPVDRMDLLVLDAIERQKGGGREP